MMLISVFVICCGAKTVVKIRPAHAAQAYKCARNLRTRLSEAALPWCDDQRSLLCLVCVQCVPAPGCVCNFPKLYVPK